MIAPSTRILILLLICCIVGFCQNVTATKPSRPNVILFFADDLGVTDVSCYGGTIDTPNIDALAASGMRFTRCWASNVCTPSRALVLSGRYGFRTGICDNCCKRGYGSYTPDSEVLLSDIAKSAGYATALFGKWAQIYGASSGEVTEAFGWDAYCHSRNKHGPEYGGYLITNYPRNPHKNLRKLSDDELNVDVMQSACLQWITDQTKAGKSFFAYYPHVAPHNSSKSSPQVPTGANHPPMPISKPDETDPKTLRADTIRYMDQQVGQLMAKLHELKIADNTLVIFTSDNGSNAGSDYELHGKPIIGGRKGDTLDPIVPFIVAWPGVIKPGTITDALTDFTDILPTLAEVAQTQKPRDRPLDGKSLLPLLRGDTEQHRSWIFSFNSTRWAIRNQDFAIAGKSNDEGVYIETYQRYLKEPYSVTKLPFDTDESKQRYSGLLQHVLEFRRESPWRFECAHLRMPLAKPKDFIDDQDDE